MNQLENILRKIENQQIRNRIKDLPKEEQRTYLIGYADGILYETKLIEFKIKYKKKDLK